MILGIYKNGKYIKGGKPTASGHQSTLKEFKHDEQRRKHKRELIQPYNKNGTPNEEFRIQYPDESQNYYGGK